MTVPAIAFEGLSKHYGDFVAVDAIDLRVPPGELLVLLGPNGAGKTTTMRMLMGLLRPTRGTARVAGLDCFSQRPEVMRLVGFVPDEPAFHDYLRGRELVRFVADMHGIDRAEGERRCATWAERLELDDALDEFATNYSKGMRKKLALLLALLHEPQVLVLDEPTNGLDPYATRTMHAVMREQIAAGHTVLFSTHLLDQAERLADRVAIIHGGKLTDCGPVTELAGSGGLEALFFARTGGGPPDDDGDAEPV